MCHVCNKLFNKIGEVEKHIKERHPGNVKPACKKCNMLFLSKNALIAHNNKTDVQSF